MLRWDVAVDDPQAVVVAPARPAEWSRPARPRVAAADHRLARLLRAVPGRPARRCGWPRRAPPRDAFLGAGVPWYLTLFGRDSIWAARMLLPLGTELAAGTLRVLARGRAPGVDPAPARRPARSCTSCGGTTFAPGRRRLRLPPVYYGTIDATPLWISLLHDAWRWGLPDARGRARCCRTSRRALGWLAEHADADGDGFLEYLDTSGHGPGQPGLEGLRRRRPLPRRPLGRGADRAGRGAGLRLRGGHGAAPPCWTRSAAPARTRWRGYAAALAERFRARVLGGRRRTAGIPALALDGDKRPVDSLTSNIGHLLGTGLLAAEEEAAGRRAGWLAPDAGRRLRPAHDVRRRRRVQPAVATTAARSGRTTRRSCSPAWPRAGFGDAGGAAWPTGCSRAAEAFDYRLPELFGGTPATVGRPGAVPGGLPPAGVVRRRGGHDRPRRRSGSTPTCPVARCGSRRWPDRSWARSRWSACASPAPRSR